MPQWLQVVIGVTALIIVSGGPGGYFEWRWLQQSHTAQRQRPPTEERPSQARKEHHNPENVGGQPPPERASPSPKSQSPEPQRPAGQHGGDNLQREGGGMDNLSAWATVAVTVGLLVVAGIQAYIYWVQARLMRFQLRVAAKAAHATKRSADALPALERAYVFVEIDPGFAEVAKTTIDKHQLSSEELRRAAQLVLERPQTAARLAIKYQFINHGKTPAIVKTMSGKLSVVQPPTPIDYSHAPLPNEIVIRAGEIFPEPVPNTKKPIYEKEGVFGSRDYFYHRAQASLSGEESIDESTANDLRQGDRFIWFYGHIVYEDVFGREHESRFCWRYDRTKNTLQRHGDSENRRR